MGKGDRKGEGGKGGGSRIKFWATDQKRKGGKQNPARGSVSGHRKSTKALRQASAWHNEHGGQCGLSRVNGGWAAESRVVPGGHVGPCTSKKGLWHWLGLR